MAAYGTSSYGGGYRIITAADGYGTYGGYGDNYSPSASNTVALSSTSAISPTGTTDFTTAALLSSSALSTSGTAGPLGISALTSTSALTSVALVVGQGGAALSSVSTLAVTASSVIGSVTLTSTSTLTTAAAAVSAFATSALASTSTLTTAGKSLALGSAALASASTLSPTGVGVRTGVTALRSTSTLAAAVNPFTVLAVAALASASTMSPRGGPRQHMQVQCFWNGQTNYSGVYATFTEFFALDYSDGGYGSAARLPPAPPSGGYNYFGVVATATITPPVTGTYTFSTFSDDGSDLSIDSGSGYVTVVSNNLGGGQAGTTQTGTIALTAGAPVNIMVRWGQGVGGWVLRADWAAPGEGWAGNLFNASPSGLSLGMVGGALPPFDDTFEFARSIGNLYPALSLSVTGIDSTNANTQAGEPGNNLRSMWATFVPTVNGAYAFDTSGSNYDTVLTVYTGTALNSLTQVGTTTSPGTLSVDLLAGITYYLQLSAAVTSPAGGTAVLNARLTASTQVGYALAVLQDSPAAFWRLTEQTGPYIDATGNGSNFTLSAGVAPTVVPGPVGAAQLWSAGANYASNPMAYKPGGGTAVEVWVYLTSYPTSNLTALGYLYYGEYNGAPGGITGPHSAISPAGLPLLVDNYAGNLTGTTPLALNRWHHIVTTIGPSGLKLIVNGQVVASNSNTYDYNGYPYGAMLHGAHSGYCGTDAIILAEPALYYHELSPARALAHYQAAPTTAALSAISTMPAGGMASPPGAVLQSVGSLGQVDSTLSIQSLAQSVISLAQYNYSQYNYVSSGSITLNVPADWTAVLTPADSFLLVISRPTFGGTLSLSGYGATWTRVASMGMTEIWLGSTPSPGTLSRPSGITISSTNTGSFYLSVMAYVYRGLRSGTDAVADLQVSPDILRTESAPGSGKFYVNFTVRNPNDRQFVLFESPYYWPYAAFYGDLATYNDQVQTYQQNNFIQIYQTITLPWTGPYPYAGSVSVAPSPTYPLGYIAFALQSAHPGLFASSSLGAAGQPAEFAISALASTSALGLGDPSIVSLVSLRSASTLGSDSTQTLFVASALQSNSYLSPSQPPVVVSLSTSTTNTVAAPTGLVAGNLLVAYLYSTDVSGQPFTVNLPSGWTFALAPQTSAVGGSLAVLYRYIGTTEPATYTFGSTYSTVRTILVQYGNVSGIGVFDGATATSFPATTSVTTGAVTSSRTDLLVALVGTKSSATAITPPPSLVQRSSTSNLTLFDQTIQPGAAPILGLTLTPADATNVATLALRGPSGSRVLVGAGAALSSTSTLSPTLGQGLFGAAILASSSALGTGAYTSLPLFAALTSTGTLGAAAAPTTEVLVPVGMVSFSALGADSTLAQAASAVLLSTSTFAADGKTGQASTALTSTSSLGSALTPVQRAGLALHSTSALGATGGRSPQAAAVLASASTLGATLFVPVFATTALTSTSALFVGGVPSIAATLVSTSTLGADLGTTTVTSAAAALSSTSLLTTISSTSMVLSGFVRLTPLSLSYNLAGESNQIASGDPALGMGLLVRVEIHALAFSQAVIPDWLPGTIVPATPANAVQTISVGAASSGTFTLTLDGYTTDLLAFNATAAQVQAALEALPNIGAGNVTATGTLDTQVTITFVGALAATAVDQIVMTIVDPLISGFGNVTTVSGGSGAIAYLPPDIGADTNTPGIPPALKSLRSQFVPLRQVSEIYPAPVLDARGRPINWQPSNIVVQDIGYYQVLVNHADCTVIGEIPVQIKDFSKHEPFGYASGNLEWPGVSGFQHIGPGAPAPLSNFKAGAQVEIRMINPAVSLTAYRTLFEGELSTLDDDNDNKTDPMKWTVLGVLYRADLQLEPPRLNQVFARDIGIAIPGLLNSVVNKTWACPRAVTGISSYRRGSWQPILTGGVQDMLSTATTADGKSQWTVKVDPGHRVHMALKDMTTVHWTVRYGQRGVITRLRLDVTQYATDIFGEGTAPDGCIWRNSKYPNLHIGGVPPYPLPPSSVFRPGSSTTGFLPLATMMRSNGYGDMVSQNTYASADVDEIKRAQSIAQISVDGIVGPQTWIALFGVGHGSLDGSRIDPLAIDPHIEQYRYAANGAIIGPNPNLDPTKLRVDRIEQFGEGVWKGDAIRSARAELARDGVPGYAGTIDLTADPNQGSRRFIEPGQNIVVQGHRGVDRKLHIASVSLTEAGTNPAVVSLTVSEKPTDLLTLAAMQSRNKDNADPARRRLLTQRTSRTHNDQIIAWDCEAGAGIIPPHAVYGGLWTVIRIPAGGYAEIVETHFQTHTPASEFAIGIFSQAVTAAQMKAVVGNPLAANASTGSGSAWVTGSPALLSMGWVIAWGDNSSPAGYSPASKGSGPKTGALIDNGSWTFQSAQPPWMWIAEYCATSNTISGRLRAGILQ